MTHKFTSLQARLEHKAAERRAWWIEHAQLATMIALVVGLVLVWAFWMADREQSVVTSDAAGEVIAAEFLPGTIQDQTKVETTKGIYLVYGTFQATKGAAAVIEMRKNGDRMLCDRGTKVCRKFVA